MSNDGHRSRNERLLTDRTELGRHRWKVERSLAWLLVNRRLTVRYERRADILTAFLHWPAR